MDKNDLLVFDMTHANNPCQSESNTVTPTLLHRMGTGGNQVPVVVIRVKKDEGKDMPTLFDFQAIGKYGEGGVAATLMHRDYKDGRDLIVHTPEETNDTYIIRRLTPKECGRLQGFPDDWCEGVPGSDSAQYMMWGNGMALPCIQFIMDGIQKNLQKEWLMNLLEG